VVNMQPDVFAAQERRKFSYYGVREMRCCVCVCVCVCVFIKLHIDRSFVLSFVLFPEFFAPFCHVSVVDVTHKTRHIQGTGECHARRC